MGRAAILSFAVVFFIGGWAIDLRPVAAEASYSAPDGYFTFPPQAFGDDSGCSILGTAPELFANQPVVKTVVTAGCSGSWSATADGGVFANGDAGFFGSAANLHLSKPVTDMAVASDGKGYWLLAGDGGVFAYGDAGFFGSAANLHLSKPVVGIAATPDDMGYWLLAADGGVFSYGDAKFYGSLVGVPLHAPVVGLDTTRDGLGYWLVAADGGVFAFGDARFAGGLAGRRLAAPVTGMARTGDGRGYWLVAADGGVFTFGDAGYYGSLATMAGLPAGSQGGSVIANPVIGLLPSESGHGYLLVPTTPRVEPSDPGQTGYALARQEWRFSASEAAVYQSVTWEQAAAYLTIGERVDPGNVSQYATGIRDLEQLAHIPEMDVTPAQSEEGQADIASLTSFFQT